MRKMLGLAVALGLAYSDGTVVCGSAAACPMRMSYSPYWTPRQATVVVANYDKPKDKSLYERLGGEDAIKAVVDDVVARAAEDPKVNFTRKGTPKEFKPK